MPVYTFCCEKHGEFDVLRSFSESSDAIDCPVCGVQTDRVFTAPALRTLSAEKRKAHETNERSRHEPRTMKRSSCGHHHAPGESCSHASAGAGETKGGLKSYGGPRPWVIEHPR